MDKIYLNKEFLIPRNSLHTNYKNEIANNG
jgi:hypothetical protein